MPKKKNAVKKGSFQAQKYAERTQRRSEAVNMMCFHNGMQYALDIASLALREEFGFGPERLKRFCGRFSEKFTEVQQASIADGREDKEAWYSDYKFEEAMKAAWGPYYQPYEVRYDED